MLKKSDIPITAKHILRNKCGDCLHFGGGGKGIPKFEKLCSFLGVKRFASAPSCFFPNVYILAKKEPDRLYQIGLLFHDFTSTEKRILMALLKSSPSFEKRYHVAFGMPVYFYLSRDYLSNYFRGFVIGVAVTGDPLIFIGSDLNGRQRSNPCTVSLYRSSIFTISEFRKKKEQLLKTKRIKDPVSLSKDFKPPIKVDIDYQPPSMESAPSEWYDRFDKRLSRRKKLKKNKDGTVVFKVKRD